MMVLRYFRMKRVVQCVCISALICVFSSGYSENGLFDLIEEDQAFWNTLLGEQSIRNKNLLYAGLVAYREKLTDLSVETFRACMEQNVSNEIVMGIADYCIGKNLFSTGRYRETIAHFERAQQKHFGPFNDIPYVIALNTAIAYLRLNETARFHEIVRRVADDEKAGRYQGLARNMLFRVDTGK